MKNKSVELDFSSCKYIGSVHREIKEKLNLPEWYGENLDALWDALVGIVKTPINIRIIFNPKISAVKNITPYINEVINVFNDAAAQYKEIKVIVERD